MEITHLQHNEWYDIVNSLSILILPIALCFMQVVHTILYVFYKCTEGSKSLIIIILLTYAYIHTYWTLLYVYCWLIFFLLFM